MRALWVCGVALLPRVPRRRQTHPSHRFRPPRPPSRATLAAGRPADPPNPRPAVGRHATHRGCASRVSCRPRGPATGRGQLPHVEGRRQAWVPGRQPDVAGDVAAIFTDIFDAGFPIRSMRPIEEFAGDDNASMAADNTSATTAGRPHRPTPLRRTPRTPTVGPWTSTRVRTRGWIPGAIASCPRRAMPRAPRARAKSFEVDRSGGPSINAAGSGRTSQPRTTSTLTPATRPGRVDPRNDTTAAPGSRCGGC